MGFGGLGKADHRQPLARAAHLREQGGDRTAIVMHQQQARLGPAGDQFRGVLERLNVNIAARQQVRDRRTTPDITID
jgi:hypothetical protein